jgi:CBS domain-containing protein
MSLFEEKMSVFTYLTLKINFLYDNPHDLSCIDPVLLDYFFTILNYNFSMKRREVVSHIMTVSPQDDLREVVGLINQKKIRHVPVVENGHVVGMISRTDISRLTFSSLFEG